ncbi:MAG: hypothetical protein ACRCXM_00545 [Beijerinckiaceae bacterium]
MKNARASVRAGLAYALLMFAAGFVLGTLRELVVRRHLGELPAILMEIPVMLAASWFAARWLIRRFDVPADARDRLVMGFVALAVLLAAEAATGIWLMGQSLRQHVLSYASLRGLVTLASQGIFALIPLLSLTVRRPI